MQIFEYFFADGRFFAPFGAAETACIYADFYYLCRI